MKNSKIAWTDNTFNPWWGCTKVSPGCEHCYAENVATRWSYNVWGPQAPRRFFDEKHWNEPRRWNREARNAGTATTVFCGSMCDVFEKHPLLESERQKLWKLISDTESLVWLLLTKRPENIAEFVPTDWLIDGFPPNVWLGTSVESQKYVSRLTILSGFSASRFVSAEPLLGPLSIRKYLWAIDWVIVGGESQPGCREMEWGWLDKIIEDCRWAYVPFFMKQKGGYPDKMDRMEEWPEQYQIQEFPAFDG